MTEKKAQIVKKEYPSGAVEITIRNAGLAGKVFQYRLEEKNGTVEDVFKHVVTAGGFLGTLKDPGIARSRKDAIIDNKKAYLSNSLILTAEDANQAPNIVQEVMKAVPQIIKIMEKQRTKK